jgi:hypothetical protein
MVMKTKTSMVTLLAFIIATILGTLLSIAQAGKLSEEEAFAIATEAYIYGYECTGQLSLRRSQSSMAPGIHRQ